MSTYVPIHRLAEEQREFDKHATRRLPGLFEFKREKMMSSPHAFLRGSAPLFYDLLRLRPDLRKPLPGRGWIDGDMHLENFGAFRTEDGRVTFDLNDFDEAIPAAAWSDDLLRLCASCFLSGGFTGLAGSHLRVLVERLCETHARAAFSRTPPRPPPVPRPVEFLLTRAEARSKRDMLESRAPAKGGKRQFIRGDKYQPLAKPAHRVVKHLFAEYAERLGGHCPDHLLRFRLEDCAQRIAGTGSLGVTRIAALVRSDDRLFLYDVKEARPAASLRAEAPENAEKITEALRLKGIATEAERVVGGARALLAGTPRRLMPLWSTRLKLSFIARQFTPSEDKLDLLKMRPGELGGIVSTLGFLLGRAHRRAASDVPRRAWSDAERHDLVRRAAEVASLVEGAYLQSALLE